MVDAHTQPATRPAGGFDERNAARSAKRLGVKMTFQAQVKKGVCTSGVSLSGVRSYVQLTPPLRPRAGSDQSSVVSALETRQLKVVGGGGEGGGVWHDNFIIILVYHV